MITCKIKEIERKIATYERWVLEEQTKLQVWKKYAKDMGF
jgi:hypothetical protein